MSVVTDYIVENVASIFLLPCIALLLPDFEVSLSLSLSPWSLALAGWGNLLLLSVHDGFHRGPHCYHYYASAEEPDGWYTWAAKTIVIKTIKCEECH